MELKVVNFNIRCCDDPNGHSIKERAPRVVQAIKKCDPDIIGLQELQETWAELLPAQFGDYEIFYRYQNLATEREATPILWKKSRFECVKKGYFWFSNTPDLESKGWDEMGYHRICVYAVLKDKETGKLFNFMNTHFGFGIREQTASVELLKQYNSRIGDYPTIITGDFNMEMDAPAYALMVQRYKDVNMETAKYKGITFHGYDPTKFGEHIDYCFVDKKITPLNQQLIGDCVKGVYPSDHYGLYSEVQI